VTIDAPDYQGFQYRTYAFPVTVLLANISANKLVTDITLPVGILRRYRCGFRRGCEGHVYVQVFHGATQILPFTPNTYFNEDNIIIEVSPVYCEIPPGSQAFSIVAWNDNDTTNQVFYPHTISNFFDVEVGGI
jgi:hypothetical protein